MMRPVVRLQENPDVEIAQQNNLRSACALAGLLTKNGASDIEFFKNIVSIPHYQTYSPLFKLVDAEDPEQIVKNKLDAFKEIYDPIVENSFKDSFKIEDGVFKKEESSSVTKYLLGRVNDNVHQNLFNVASPLKYDTDKKFHKKIMDRKDMYEGIDDTLSKLNQEELNKKLHRSIDKILLAHRNSKIFLILMSGPFLIGFYIFKYALKILVFYYLLKKKKPAVKTEDEKQEKTGEESKPEVTAE